MRTLDKTHWSKKSCNIEGNREVFVQRVLFHYRVSRQNNVLYTLMNDVFLLLKKLCLILMNKYSLINDPTRFDIGKKQLMINYLLVLLGSVTYKPNNKLLERLLRVRV